MIAPHLMASESDGALYDTRAPDWSRKAPVRAIYSRQFREIDSLAKVKASLRAGAYAWPGGYPVYFVTRDGAALSFDSARDCWRQIVAEFMDDSSTGWRIVGADVNYEDSELTCDHSGERIPSAYGDD